jgi:WhiB family transcriptional regulator, redox-sensing transcriptional regulator
MGTTTLSLTPSPASTDTVRRDLLSPGTDLPVLPARQPWMAEAACKGRTTLFFGLAGERPERRVRREARARKVCESCPVLEPCRQMARLNGENGYWGGESEEERAAAGYAPVSISRRSVQEAAAAGLRQRAEAS